MRGIRILGTWMRRGILTLLLLLTVVGVSQARWIPLLYETFESLSINSWPWSRSGHPWGIAADAGTHAWNVEENTIFHPGPTTYIRSMWCAGYPNDLQAGVDYYPAGYTTIAYWGPFDLTDAVSSKGSHWLFADLESNAFGSGDQYMVISSSSDPRDTGTWDTMFVLGTNGTMGEWDNYSFNFDTLREHGTGDTISVLGQDGLYIGFVFAADGDNNRGFGCFVDDISFGYDDGQYDFERRSLTLEDPNDQFIMYQSLYVNTPVRIRARFVAHGNYLSSEVTHYLIINDAIVDSVRGAYQGDTYGQTYEVAFDSIYTPTEEGIATIQLSLDAHGEQEEFDEDNNIQEVEFDILPENAPPSIVFHQPSIDGLVVNEDVAEIIFTATNTPSVENAYVSFFYDDDLDPTEVTPIQGALGVQISGVQDTVKWYNSLVPNGDYYILAVMDDYFHETRQAYAQGTVTINHTDVVEGENGAEIPDQFRLVSVYPNPFNPTVEIAFEMPMRADVTATWYSIDGRQVERQVMKSLSPGAQRFSWTPHNLPSGVYLLNLQTARASVQSKVVFMK